MFKSIILASLICLSACSAPVITKSNTEMVRVGQNVYYSNTVEKGFWDQKVATTAWGLWWVTAYGPIGVGYFTWQRNIDNPMEAEKISDFLDKLPNAPIK